MSFWAGDFENIEQHLGAQLHALNLGNHFWTRLELNIATKGFLRPFFFSFSLPNLPAILCRASIVGLWQFAARVRKLVDHRQAAFVINTSAERRVC